MTSSFSSKKLGSMGNPENLTVLSMADDGIKHTTIKINGINLHFAEKGEGLIVLFLHGFPELWFSWRHQINALAALGYRAVAPDLRGFGDTDAPADASKYTYSHNVGDLVALIDTLGADRVFVVGHDWGAVVAWLLCLFRPDRIRALVNLGVAYGRRDPNCFPMDAWKAFYGEDYYMCRFQVPGEMEAEIAEAGGAEKLLGKLFSHQTASPWFFPKGKWIKNTPPRPAWISEVEFGYYVSKFEQKGFTGGLNIYRAINLNWELTAPWTGAKVLVPAKFVVGDMDFVYHMPGVQDYVQGGGMQKDVPLLKEVVVMEGVGHFLQQEKPEEISKHIYDFIRLF